MLTEFGKKVRKARIDVGVTLFDMSKELGVTASYLSQMETGNRNVRPGFVKVLEKYFSDKGLEIELQEVAESSNRYKSLSIAGLDQRVQSLVTGFARADLSDEDIRHLTEILKEIKSR